MPEMHAETCPGCDGTVYVCDDCQFETTDQSIADDHECGDPGTWVKV